MVSLKDLPDDCTITILCSTGCDRFHYDYDNRTEHKCSKIKVGIKWEGDCLFCEKYDELCIGLNNNFLLKPYERHYFDCLINGKKENLTGSLGLANLIGNRIGKFRIIREVRHGYVSFNKSYFIKTDFYNSLEEPFEVSKNY